MKIYTIIGGVHGVGKSSFLGALKCCTADLGMIVDTDKMIAQIDNGESIGEKRFSKMIDDCMDKGISFTQETCLSEHGIEDLLQKAKNRGYYTRLYYIGLDTVTESKQRIANRVARGGHNINTRDVECCFAGRWVAIKDVLPYCDEAAFYDNDNGFLQVASYRNGELILEGAVQPMWILELSNYLKSSLN